MRVQCFAARWRVAPMTAKRPIALPLKSVNQSAPSAPKTSASAVIPAGRSNWVSAPVVLIRPILPAVDVDHENQRAPSGPATIATAVDGAVVIGYSVTIPLGVMR